jgi:hypothetical protein
VRRQAQRGEYRENRVPYIVRETGVTATRRCGREDDLPFQLENKAKWAMISLEPAVIRLPTGTGKYDGAGRPRELGTSHTKNLNLEAVSQITWSLLQFSRVPDTWVGVEVPATCSVLYSVPTPY